MNVISTLTELDRHEDRLIEQFQAHACFRQLDQLSQAAFLDLLLQRRFLSLAFTPLYDLAIDGLADVKARQVARRILREEYPDERGAIPSHREDLVSDLLRIGVTRQALVNTQPTSATLAMLRATFALFAGDPDDGLYQVKLLTILRFWGEVLIAAEYQMLWPRLQTLGLTAQGPNRSIFYYLHFVHDAKQKSLTQLSLIAATHADLLGVTLKTLLTSEAAIQQCAQVESAIVQVKAQFYDQFVQ